VPIPTPSEKEEERYEVPEFVLATWRVIAAHRRWAWRSSVGTPVVHYLSLSALCLRIAVHVRFHVEITAS